MDTTILMGIVRHLLTLAGGIMVSKGWINSGIMDQIIGAILTIVPIIWTTVDKIQTGQAIKNTAINAARTGDSTPNLQPPAGPVGADKFPGGS